MRRNTRSAFANPILIGAVTVLVLLIAVFLAYTANRGLPFVPTRELKVDIANGADLTAGSDVREGGFRIGLVSDMEPVQLPDGRTVAQLTLHLTPAHGQRSGELDAPRSAPRRCSASSTSTSTRARPSR